MVVKFVRSISFYPRDLQGFKEVTGIYKIESSFRFWFISIFFFQIPASLDARVGACVENRTAVVYGQKIQMNFACVCDQDKCNRSREEVESEAKSNGGVFLRSIALLVAAVMIFITTFDEVILR